MIECVSPTWPSRLTEFLIHPQPETRGLRWNLSTASGADGWGKTGFPITHHRKQAAYKKRAKTTKKKANGKQREEWNETVQAVSLWLIQANMGLSTIQFTSTEISVSYRSISWLKVDHKIPFGFRRRAARKVITALLPALLLPAAVSGGSFSSKHGKWSRNHVKLQKAFCCWHLLQSLLSSHGFFFFLVSCG